MKVRQHGTNLWQLTTFRVVNCYLVKEDCGLTLVDAALPGGGKGIEQAAQALGMPITRITLTHAHLDHAGSLDEVYQRFPDAKVALTFRTTEFLQGDLSLKPEEPQARLRGNFIRSATGATRVLAPGDELGSLRVVAAPGHSPDQVAFLDERDGSLIAGDAFQTLGGIAVSGIPRWLFPFPALATWHLPTALESAERLRQLNPTLLAVGHGRVLEDPLVGMDEAIAEARAKL